MTRRVTQADFDAMQAHADRVLAAAHHGARDNEWILGLLGIAVCSALRSAPPDCRMEVATAWCGFMLAALEQSLNDAVLH